MPQAFADKLKSFPMSPQLGESLERAYGFAREQSHRAVTLEHLLLALTEDTEAAVILESAEVDLARLRADVSGYLGGLLEDMRAAGETDPALDADVMRVLQAATAAAQQSRRRNINGAIVLAAIVGDGKSPAAGLLKALGMTFEGAIRALQRANAQARFRSPPARPSPAIAPTQAEAGSGTGSSATSAEEFLAAARARIQQRAAARGEIGPPAKEAGSPPPAVATEARSVPPTEGSAAERTELTPKTLAAAIRQVSTSPDPSNAALIPSDGAKVPAEPVPLVPVTAPAPPAPAAAPVPSFAQAVPAAAAAHPAPAPPPNPRPATPSPRPARGDAPIPLSGRHLRMGEGPARPPLPQETGLPPGPQPANRPPGPAPWGANGAAGVALQVPRGMPRPPVGGPEGGGATIVPLQTRSGTSPTTSGLPKRGPLVESVPRRMRAGVPSAAEVRISRDKVDGLLRALSSPGTRPEACPTRTLTIRLRAPNGGFWIEAHAAETQWIERSTGNPNDTIESWHWTVTPRRHGRNRLLLTVSARMVGADGQVADSMPSDRTIDVKVARNYALLARRTIGWGAALIAAVALGYLAHDLLPVAAFLFR